MAGYGGYTSWSDLMDAVNQQIAQEQQMGVGNGTESPSQYKINYKDGTSGYATVGIPGTDQTPQVYYGDKNSSRDSLLSPDGNGGITSNYGFAPDNAGIVGGLATNPGFLLAAAPLAAGALAGGFSGVGAAGAGAAGDAAGAAGSVGAGAGGGAVGSGLGGGITSLGVGADGIPAFTGAYSAAGAGGLTAGQIAAGAAGAGAVGASMSGNSVDTSNYSNEGNNYPTSESTANSPVNATSGGWTLPSLQQAYNAGKLSLSAYNAIKGSLGSGASGGGMDISNGLLGAGAAAAIAGGLFKHTDINDMGSKADQTGLENNSNDLMNQWHNYMFPALQAQVGKTGAQADQYTQSMNDQAAKATSWADAYHNDPILANMRAQAANYNTDGNIERQSALAMGDVNTQFANQTLAQKQALEGMGVAPDSGRFAGMMQGQGVQQAAAAAAAGSRARDAAVQLGWQKQMDALNATNANAGVSGNMLGIAQSAGAAGLAAQNTQLGNINTVNTAGNNTTTAANAGLNDAGAIGTKLSGIQSTQNAADDAGYGKVLGAGLQALGGSGGLGSALSNVGGAIKNGYNTLTSGWGGTGTGTGSTSGATGASGSGLPMPTDTNPSGASDSAFDTSNIA